MRLNHGITPRCGFGILGLTFKKAFELDMRHFLPVYQVFHFFNKRLAPFNDFADLIQVEFYKWSIIGLLVIINTCIALNLAM